MPDAGVGIRDGLAQGGRHVLVRHVRLCRSFVQFHSNELLVFGVIRLNFLELGKSARVVDVKLVVGY